MPQVDKATFFSIVTWSFIVYIGGFLLLNSQQLFTFLASLKIWAKRAAQLFTAALGKRRQLSAALFFPLVTL
jgi:multisubunit Na+/H+ antiporter MnhC subunit